jgi:nucleotide-binding universal stress UspA family protein/copper chaperone CopZ
MHDSVTGPTAQLHSRVTTIAETDELVHGWSVVTSTIRSMITRLKLPGIGDGTDVAHAEKTLEAVPGVRSVIIERGTETAIVEHDGADLNELRAAAKTLGFHSAIVEESASAKPLEAGPGKIVFVPIDFSAITDRVVAEAAKLTRALGGRLMLAHVTEPTSGVVDYAAIVVAVAQVNEAAVKHSTERLTQLERQLKSDGLDAASIHLTGAPVSEIIEQARSLSADYIVIGSHGHTAFYELLVGGTAHGILKRAPCPVVVVSPPSKHEAERGH